MVLKSGQGSKTLSRRGRDGFSIFFSFFFFEAAYSNEGIKLPLILTYRVARALRGGLCFPSKS